MRTPQTITHMRYMDDIVILGNNKKELHKIFKKIEEYLKTLRLCPKENWQVFLFDYVDKNGIHRGRPIDFMGFKFYRDKTTIRKSIFLRACRLARRISKKMKISWRDACQILSYMGWFYPTDTFNAYKLALNPNRIFPVRVFCCSKIPARENLTKNQSKIDYFSRSGKLVCRCSAIPNTFKRGYFQNGNTLFFYANILSGFLTKLDAPGQYFS